VGIWYSTWYTINATNDPIPNLWKEWNISYVPKHSDGSYYQYDSKNISVIDDHIMMLTENQIDFVLFDFTNRIQTWWITYRGVTFAERLKYWTDLNKTSLKIAVAIGAI
jgi:hypothetical protein